MSVDYPEDVAWLKRSVPVLSTLSDEAVEALYGEWSEEFWCAGWLIMDDGTIGEFAGWLSKRGDP